MGTKKGVCNKLNIFLVLRTFCYVVVDQRDMCGTNLRLD